MSVTCDEKILMHLQWNILHVARNNEQRTVWIRKVNSVIQFIFDKLNGYFNAIFFNPYSENTKNENGEPIYLTW